MLTTDQMHRLQTQRTAIAFWNTYKHDDTKIFTSVGQYIQIKGLPSDSANR